MEAFATKVIRVVHLFGSCTVYYFAVNSVFFKKTRKSQADGEKLYYAKTFNRGPKMESHKEYRLEETSF